MNTLSAGHRELRFLLRDRSFVAWLLVTLLLASVAVAGGIGEVAKQRDTIDRLAVADAEDRLDAVTNYSDWGDIAYYSFHLTYDEPSDFAFAALGTRDQEPWKHRVRMLALEGQIYERDAGNPVLALTGRFDFAFFVAFVLPLVLIGMLHDLQSRERSAGRHALLITTSAKVSSPWRLRAVLRAALVLLAAVLPLLVGAVVSGTSAGTVAFALLFVSVYLAFWAVVCYAFARWQRSSAVILATLLGIWVMLSVVGPASTKAFIDYRVPVPEGADILLTQREAVNDAWDLPKRTTMDAFVARHPQWSDIVLNEDTFEWRWYYAFQQVGDQQAEQLSLAYRDGRQQRDRLAGLAAWLTPPALLERALQRLAHTDLKAHMAYQDSVRDFHAQLRAFYYPKLFPDTPYDPTALDEMPLFLSGDDD